MVVCHARYCNLQISKKLCIFKYFWHYENARHVDTLAWVSPGIFPVGDKKRMVENSIKINVGIGVEKMKKIETIKKFKKI
jgi:hypothetical protein